jgi:L-2-hydroxyglutarate oxidase
VGIAGLHVTETGIVDYTAVTSAFARLVQEAGGEIRTGARVTSVGRQPSGLVLETTAGPVEARTLINCGGLQSDRVARMCGVEPGVEIIPFRGEYYELVKERQGLVRNLIYPVPDPRFPFLGVHFTRMIRGGIEAGPNAVLAFAREGYQKTDVNLADLFDALSFPGLWRFLGKHKRMSWEELQRSFSKKRFCASLQRLVPAIQPGDLVPGGAGVRAQAMRADGELVQDFCLIQRPRALHVLNAPSPAATASLAIGAEIAREIADASK